MKHSVLALVLLAASLQACASGARSEAMRPSSPTAVTQRHAGSVHVVVAGGRETNPLWKSDISSEAFSTALSDAIRESGLFADLRGGAPSDYMLEVVMVDVDQPSFGASLTVNLTARWSLVSTKTNQTVWKSDISKAYTAAFSDSFVAVTRLRLANEGAARENIKAGLEEIARLRL